MRGARGLLLLVIVLVAGLLAGVWTVVSPWVVGYPAGAHGAWSSLTWASVWVGAVVAAASALGLVLTCAAALPAEQRRPTQAGAEEP